jgi:hypothetical protein
MEKQNFDNFPIGKEEFMAQVRLALADVLGRYRNQPNLLRPKLNACMEENFGVRSREINLQIPEDSKNISMQFSHPVHGDMTFEA